MPTENRSSNTEQMVSVPREWVENYAGLLEERCAYEVSERVQAVLAQPAEQRQGEPVALSARKDTTQHWAEPGGVHKAEGWNAYHEELARLGPLYTHPAPFQQGEPVAFYREFVDGREYCEKPFTNDWTPLYTHAEAGEVERLRAELEKSKANSKQLAEREAALDALNEIATGYKRDLDEAHALLRGIHDGEISGFERYSKIEALLSASAEPSAPVERDDLTSMVDAAMVEMAGIHPPLKRSECERLIRAALERKP